MLRTKEPSTLLEVCEQVTGTVFGNAYFLMPLIALNFKTISPPHPPAISWPRSNTAFFLKLFLEMCTAEQHSFLVVCSITLMTSVYSCSCILFIYLWGFGCFLIDLWFIKFDIANIFHLLLMFYLCVFPMHRNFL